MPSEHFKFIVTDIIQNLVRRAFTFNCLQCSFMQINVACRYILVMWYSHCLLLPKVSSLYRCDLMREVQMNVRCFLIFCMNKPLLKSSRQRVARIHKNSSVCCLRLVKRLLAGFISSKDPSSSRHLKFEMAVNNRFLIINPQTQQNHRNL